jgi:hypothetical protein
VCFFDELSWKEEEAAAKNLERVDFWVPSFVLQRRETRRKELKRTGFR